MNISNRRDIFWRAALTWLLFIPIVFLNATVHTALFQMLVT